MPTGKPTPIPFPISTFPGKSPQESAGRLINVYAEKLGQDGTSDYTRRRSAGLSLHASTANVGYRGGLVVGNLSYDCWENIASTVNSAGAASSIGNFPGTQNVSMARNQAVPTADVVAVDIDNGAYVLGSATLTAATCTATIGGTSFNKGDSIDLIFLNPYISDLPVTINYVLGTGETASTVAAALNTGIGANTVLVNNNISSTAFGAVLTIKHEGSLGNSTSLTYSVGGEQFPASTSLGAISSVAGGTCAITGVNAPAGSLIAVVVSEISANLGAVSDGVNGAYTLALSQGFNGGSDIGAIFYFENSAALSGATITYNKATSGSHTTMFALYVLGAATSQALDIAVSAAATGTSSTPFVTSGLPLSTNELMVGAAAYNSNDTFTQAPKFSTPAEQATASTNLTVAGGTQFVAAEAKTIFAPSLSGSDAWAAMIVGFMPASGTETITFAPTTGNLSGGAGTPGAFTGVPTAYNGQGSLPQPNSVCFQDGYLFFTTASGQCYATTINSLLMSPLTYITAEAKSDVTLLRGIAFSGFLMLFTTGSCEVWQDAANPAPQFPYSRISVLEFGLAQATAIAGFETGFSELMWVAQDYGVHWMQPGSLSETKVSPPDLDRLIETEIKEGEKLEASCYIAAGKKFWVLSSQDWTWEFNLQTGKWNERQSLGSTGQFGRWRARGGHPAFGKWLCGDELTGNLLYIDEDNFTENGAVQLCRIESGPVRGFPGQIRVARADFDMVLGSGIAVGDLTMGVSNAVSGTNGVVRLTVNSVFQAQTDDICIVSDVTGTTEANGTWPITIIDATHIELQGSVFANAYVSGGTVIDLTSPPNAVAPSIAVSMSKDGGLNWGNPLIRQVGQQGSSLQQRVAVKNMGLSGPMGDRWRIDISDPVDFSFFGGTQSSDPRSVG